MFRFIWGGEPLYKYNEDDWTVLNRGYLMIKVVTQRVGVGYAPRRALSNQNQAFL